MLRKIVKKQYNVGKKVTGLHDLVWGDFTGITGDVSRLVGSFGGSMLWMKHALTFFVISVVVGVSDDQNIYTICYLENKDIFNLHDGSFARDPYFAGLDYFI